MKLTKYIIWTTKLEDTNIIMALVKDDCDIMMTISDTILCVESQLTPSNIREKIGDNMEMACLEMDDNFINRLLTKKFLANEKKNFFRFLEMTKAPTTINEALDLISERGGLKFLNQRERQALDNLTKNSNQGYN